VEDHQIDGGLGSAIAEVLAEHHPAHLKRVGVKGVFGESGSCSELYKKYGLDSTGIVKASEEALGLKR
jgi:transketolase